MYIYKKNIYIYLYIYININLLNYIFVVICNMFRRPLRWNTSKPFISDSVSSAVSSPYKTFARI